MLLRIINEEISNFDFLNNDKYEKEMDVVRLVSNEDFQKQFICDTLLNKKDRIKISINDSGVGGNWEDEPEDVTYLTLEYLTTIEYKYDPSKDSVKFSLDFSSNKINVSASGWNNPGNWGRYEEPSSDKWFDSIYWSDIDVNLYSVDGDEIKFIAFEKAPTEIQNLFIRAFTETFIESSTIDIRIKDKYNKAMAINSYC